MLLGITIASAGIFIIAGQRLNLNSKTDWYYPIMPETEEWLMYDDKAQMLEVLQIPDEILKLLSESAILIKKNNWINIVVRTYMVYEGGKPWRIRILFRK